jgi:ferredoxin
MLKFKVEVDREGCIACSNCYTIDPDHFESDSQGKSQVKGGKTNGKSNGIFDDGKLSIAQEAESSCPMSVIKVIPRLHPRRINLPRKPH